eukprot:m.152061 g.152061  ORF g.152061 m.152061 type:complete len:64 (+) comp14311_c0_seq6:7027-7218(+)
MQRQPQPIQPIGTGAPSRKHGVEPSHMCGRYHLIDCIRSIQEKDDETDEAHDGQLAKKALNNV